MTSDSYVLRPDAIRSIASEVEGLLSHAGGVVGELSSTVLDALAFAGIGSSVATGNAAMQGNQVSALQSFVKLLADVKNLIGASVDGYDQADAAVATALGGGQNVHGSDADGGQIAHAADPDAADQDSAAQPADLADDQTLRDQLGRHEGRRVHVYTDTEGHPTIGVGFNLDRAGARAALSAVGADYDAVRAGRQDLTDAQIDQLLATDTRTAVATARGYFAGFDQLDTARQRALTDMAFNLGPNRLAGFHHLHTALQNGDYDAAADAMADSHWARQVGHRATDLIGQMRNGD